MNSKWFLTEDNTACGGTAPPPTAPPPTEPPTGCGSPQYNDDSWCDDENNNAGCDYDGGACCNNNYPGMKESTSAPSQLQYFQ